MAKRAPRQAKPYVFIFQLGKQARVGKKRVPAALASAPCYYHREEHRDLAEELRAIPEPDLSDRDVDVTFAAIDSFVEANELEPEICTDVELEGGEERADSRVFHPGASFEEARAALARGGFVVCRVIDPLAVPRVELTPAETVEQAAQDLARHLDLTSLALVLDRVEQGAELPRHATQAESIVTLMLGGAHAKAFGDTVCAAAPGWHPELRDTLLLLAGRAVQASPSAALRAFLDALPPAEDAAVKRRLQAFGLPPGGSGAPAKPVTKARPVQAEAARPARKAGSAEARIARIEAAAKKAGVRLPGGASEAAIAAAEAEMGVTFPAGVRAFYRAHDGGPDGELVCGNRELLSLSGMVRQWQMYKEAFDAGELEDDEEVEADEGVAPSWWIPAWIPVTYDLGGNHDVLDLAPAEGGKKGQIVAVWHDDAARTVEGTSFLSWLEEQAWGAPT